MRYLHVMSRPKVIDHEHDTVWTEAYVDSAVSINNHACIVCVQHLCSFTKLYYVSHSHTLTANQQKHQKQDKIAELL